MVPETSAAMPDLNAFEALVRSRRATRSFRTDPLPEGMLDRLLDAAHWAPSGYNLQPTHFFVVEDSALKPALAAACMGQKQIVQAPATVVFAGDRRVFDNHFEQILAMEREAGCINADYERKLRSVVPLAFGHGPAGLGWAWKALAAPLLQWFRPVPELPAVHKRLWLSKQVMLSAMNFMLAATAAGLATVPMEGFDNARVRAVLSIPRRFSIFLVVPVGYAASGRALKTRLPLEKLVHRIHPPATGGGAPTR